MKRVCALELASDGLIGFGLLCLALAALLRTVSLPAGCGFTKERKPL